MEALTRGTSGSISSEHLQISAATYPGARAKKNPLCLGLAKRTPSPPPSPPLPSLSLEHLNSKLNRDDGALLPSAAPTPKASSGSKALQGGRILVPSRGPDNDAMRARNGGCRVGLRRVASDPGLRVTGMRSVGPSGHPARAAATWTAPPATKTPRTLRGVVRKASSLVISYPVPIYSSPVQARVKSPDVQSSRKSIFKKRVSFADDLEAAGPKPRLPVNTRDDGVAREAARHKSKMLLDSLYDLRRVRTADAPAPVDPATSDGTPAPPEAPNDKIIDLPLMYTTLADLDDTEAPLRRTQALLEEVQAPVRDHGGTRHATALISARTLAVVKRKADLLRTVDARLSTFEAAHARSDELVGTLLVQDAETPAELIGLKKFTAMHVHKDGNPADADKSNFQLFVASFGLPQQHKYTLRLQRDLAEASTWWAERTLKEAQIGASHEAIQRLIEVLKAVSGDPNHPVLKEVYKILGERLAEAVLKAAEKLQARDAAKVESSTVPQPESALHAAEGIKAEMVQAVAMGAPPKHPAMARSKEIEVKLRMEEKSRIADKVLLFAEAAQDRDTQQEEAAAPSVPKVGPASDAADSIEREVNSAVAKGVLETDSRLQEAKTIAKALRDKDGTRKRLAAREARLAAKAKEEQG